MRFLALLPILACGESDAPGPLPPDRSGEGVQFGALLEPPSGRVLHGWGQLSGAWTQSETAGQGDLQDLQDYRELVGALAPAMISLYVAPVPNQVQPFEENVEALVERERPIVLNVGLYFLSIEKDVAAGKYDQELRKILSVLRRADVPVLLRIGYEFNNPWAPYDPDLFVDSFRRIHGLILEQSACRIATAWNASALGLQKFPSDPWYPGDEVVDWWSFNVFHDEEFSLDELAEFLERARAHGKPVLIGEASPVLSSRIPMRVRGPASEEEAISWYQRFFELLRRRPEIKAFSLIATDFRRIRSQTPGFGWPNTRLDAWPGVPSLVALGLEDPRFLHAEAFRGSLRQGIRLASRECGVSPEG